MNADEIISQIIADIRRRSGLRHAWDDIDVDIRNEIAAKWRTFFVSPEGGAIALLRDVDRHLNIVATERDVTARNSAFDIIREAVADYLESLPQLSAEGEK